MWILAGSHNGIGSKVYPFTEFILIVIKNLTNNGLYVYEV